MACNSGENPALPGLTFKRCQLVQQSEESFWYLGSSLRLRLTWFEREGMPAKMSLQTGHTTRLVGADISSSQSSKAQVHGLGVAKVNRHSISSVVMLACLFALFLGGVVTCTSCAQAGACQ